MSSSIERIERAVRESLRAAAAGTGNAPYVVATSGGVDSVVVAHAARSVGLPVALAHVHHGLRGGEADRDEALVASLANDWGCAVRIVRLGDRLAAADRGASLQAEARRMRYAALEEMCGELGSGVLVTGHHRDDQAETVLIQMLRGAGPDGLSGMPTLRALSPGSRIRIVRPLLSVGRADILEYARTRALPWNEDASNRKEHYLRNAIRHRVLPILDEVSGRDAAARIAQAAELVRAYREADVDPLVDGLVAGAVRTLPDGVALVSDSVLEPLTDVWRGRLVLRLLADTLPAARRTRATVRRVLDLLSSQPGRLVPVGGGAVWRERGGLAFAPDCPSPAPADLVIGKPASWDGRAIRLECTEEVFVAGDPWSMRIDADRVSAPLAVRAWQPGDRVHPRGMQGSRKVKEILTDARIPCHLRSRAPVVVSGSDVVWVVGVRADRRFLAGPRTRRPLRLVVEEPR